MKRRTALRSLLTLPAAMALPVRLPGQASAAAPAAAAPPATDSETPTTPTVDADTHAATVVRTFNPEQFAALRQLSVILVPSLPDTPGALEAKAAEFLDFLIGQSSAEQVTLYKQGLDRLNEEARKRSGKPFGELTAEQAAPLLAPLGAPWSYEPPQDSLARFLLAAKEDVLKATHNSREYISVASGRNRRASGIGIYWYPISD